MCYDVMSRWTHEAGGSGANMSFKYKTEERQLQQERKLRPINKVQIINIKTNTRKLRRAGTHNWCETRQTDEEKHRDYTHKGGWDD